MFLVCESLPYSVMFGQHIRLRWWQRGGRGDPSIVEAWDDGVKVAVPGRRDLNARLHEETGTLIARKRGGSGTVLDSSNMILYKDNRLICGNCLSTLQSDHRCPNAACPN